MFRVALKNLLAHKLRGAFLALCVVLGVSFVSGTYVLTDTILNTFNGIFSDVYDKVDVTVRSRSELGLDASRPPIPESTLDKVRQVDGVKDAQGGVFAIGAEIIGADGDRVGNPQAPAFGLEWSPNDALTPLTLREGRKPSGPNEIAIDARAFADSGYQLGDQVNVVTPEGIRSFTLVGVAGFGKADNIAGATLAIFDLPTAQQVMQRVGQFDGISVQAEPGVSDEVLQERIQAALPAEMEAVTSATLTDESNESLKEGLQFFNIFMLAFAYIALFVGAFIIYNTFSIVVTERTREMALLRAIGASGGQVLGSVVLEALVIGVLASLAGLGLGVLMAFGLRALLEGFGIDLPDGGTVIAARTIVVAMIGGTLITVLSAIAPAVRAARVPPIAAMRSFTPTARAATIRRNVTGLVGTVVGVALVLSGLNGNGLWRVGVGAVLLFLGVAMLAPMIARPVAGVLGRPIRELRGAQGLLARQNAMRSARRTATTASALMIGTALMAGSLILSSSLTRSVDRAVSKGAIAELVVRTDSQLGFSPAVREEAKSVPGVQEAYAYRTAVFRLGTADKQLTAIDPLALDTTRDDAAFDVGLESGDLSGLAQGGVAVSDKAADDHGWRVGDRISMTFASETINPPITAIYTENQLVGDYIVSLSTFEQGYADSLDFLVLISLAPGADLNTVKAELNTVISDRYPGVKVQDKDEYIGDVKKQVNQFLGLITALLGLAIIIAVFGVLIAMLLAVFERTRELGLLRAVGMARSQLRSMVRWEAAIISVFGALLGTALGLFFGYSLTRALRDQGIRSIVVPVPTLVILVVIITLLGIAAALYPARRASRLNILTAVSSE